MWPRDEPSSEADRFWDVQRKCWILHESGYCTLLTTSCEGWFFFFFNVVTRSRGTPIHVKFTIPKQHHSPFLPYIQEVLIRNVVEFPHYVQDVGLQWRERWNKAQHSKGGDWGTLNKCCSTRLAAVSHFRWSLCCTVAARERVSFRGVKCHQLRDALQINQRNITSSCSLTHREEKKKALVHSADPLHLTKSDNHQVVFIRFFCSLRSKCITRSHALKKPSSKNWNPDNYCSCQQPEHVGQHYTTFIEVILTVFKGAVYLRESIGNFISV